MWLQGAVKRASMADPASATAGASRSRRKRALPPQRAQAKRIRTQSPTSSKVSNNRLQILLANFGIGLLLGQVAKFSK